MIVENLWNMKISIFATTFALATKVFGHGGVYSYEIDGVHYPGYVQHQPLAFETSIDLSLPATNGLNPHIIKATSSNAHGTKIPSRTLFRPT